MADLSPGARLVQEWSATYKDANDFADLARRIDAALAEQQQELSMRELEAKLAEREAQISAVRDRVQVFLDQCTGPMHDGGDLGEWLWRKEQLDLTLTNIAATARAFVERIQAEERERLIKVICRWCRQNYELKEVHTAQWEDEPWTHFKNGLPIAPCDAAAIRALPPRRGT